MPAPDAMFVVIKISYKIFYNRFRVIRAQNLLQSLWNGSKCQKKHKWHTQKEKLSRYYYFSLYFELFCAITVFPYKTLTRTLLGMSCCMLTIPKGAEATCGFTTPLEFGHFTLLSAHAQFTPPAHFCKIKQSYTLQS